MGSLGFPKTTPPRLRGNAMRKLRFEIFMRDGGRCAYVHDGKRCWQLVSFNGRSSSYPPMHLAHRRNKRMWGDTPENCFCCCPTHHLVDMHNPKSVPRKELVT